MTFSITVKELNALIKLLAQHRVSNKLLGTDTMSPELESLRAKVLKLSTQCIELSKRKQEPTYRAGRVKRFFHRFPKVLEDLEAFQTFREKAKFLEDRHSFYISPESLRNFIKRNYPEVYKVK